MKVTILIPIYNAEKTIAETIQSCIDQTYKDIEILCVNDHCTDNTLQVLSQFNDPRIQVINTPDGQKGIVDALNEGIRQSTGEFIARMDADDIMHPQRIELQLQEFYKNKELCICSSNATILQEDGKLTSLNLLSTNKFNDIEIDCRIIHPSIMFRKDFLVKYDLFYDKEFEYVEDYELWFKIKSLNLKFDFYKNINLNLIYYRLGKDRITSIKNKEQTEKVKKIYNKYKIKPYISIISLDKNVPVKCDITNFEIVETLEQANGKYIAYSGFENINRFKAQLSVLEHDERLIGCGSYIKTKNGKYFYNEDSSLLESSLYKGIIPIEQKTFLFRNKNIYEKNFFTLLCKLDNFGSLTNVKETLVICDNYTNNNDNYSNTREERIEIAKKELKNIINIIHINISGDNNFSGVERYLKTLTENYPPNIKCLRINLIASNKFFIDTSDKYFLKVYYNLEETPLEHLNDLFYDSFKKYFINKRNLIIQSNCLNLYTFLTYLRRKINFKHVCALHCVPYREVIKQSREKYQELELKLLNREEEFNDISMSIDALNLADHVILNTLDSEYYYKRCGYTTPYTVIYNGVEKIKKNSVKFYKNNNKNFKFLFVGHGGPSKGLDQLISIIESFHHKFNVELHCAGAIEKDIAEYAVKNNLPIIIHGVLNTENLHKLYNEIDCLLIATAHETCSYAALEALSIGLPIIATNTHGIHEILDNVGLLIDIDKRAIIDKEMYESAMEKVIVDEKLREEMSKRSINRYKQYTKEIMMEKMLKLYKDLLK